MFIVGDSDCRGCFSRLYGLEPLSTDEPVEEIKEDDDTTEKRVVPTKQ
jgi:hypothetical protein